MNYIVLNNEKIVIDIENGLSFYKEKNNKLYPLNEKEFLYIKKLFNRDDNYFESLESSINSNKSISNISLIKVMFEFLEQNIPEEDKDNFYENIKTLKLNFHDVDTNLAARYDAYNNIIEIEKDKIDEINQSLKTGNFDLQTGINLIHELTHMASRRKEENNFYCGFTKYPSAYESDKNDGLTEGMTELIAINAFQSNHKYMSPYYFELCFVNQLLNLVGRPILVESYFGNKGIKDLEIQLNKIIPDKDKSNLLFRLIELNFQALKLRRPQNFAGRVQDMLLDYFEAKLEYLISTKEYTKEQIEYLIYYFENSLVKPELLHLINKDPDNYIGLIESNERFYEIVNKYNKLNRSKTL